MNARVLCFVLLTWCLWACGENENEKTEILKGEFQIANAIGPATKKPQLSENGGGQFASGDTVMLFFQAADQMGHRDYPYVFGKRHYWMDWGLPEGIGKFQLAGCYPPIVTNEPENFAWNVNERKGWSDLLLASEVEVNMGSSEEIPLAFSHALHKLVVELIPDGTSITQNLLSDAVINCRHVLPVAKVNLLTGRVLGAEGDPAELSAIGSKGMFIIPAQPVGDIEIGINVDGRNFIYKLFDSQVDGRPLTQLLANQALVIKIKVSKGAFVIAGESISGWGVQGEINDSIII